MKLFYSSASPYVRKVVVTAIEAGLDSEIERETPSSSVWIANGDAEVSDKNPLGKIPTLITRDGDALIDSTLICEYLASLVPDAGLLPPNGRDRWKVRRLEALAQGALDAIMLRNVETLFRPENLRSEDYVARQNTKMDRTFDFFEAEIDHDGAQPLPGKPVNLGTITLGVTLAYLTQRFGDESWRNNRPVLSHWQDEFARRDSMQATVPPSLPPAHLDPRQN